MATKKCSKKCSDFYCQNCDYFTVKKSSFEAHLLTQKHFSNESATNGNKKNAQKFFTCQNCSKNYQDRTGLWRHSKKCISENICTEISSNNNPINQDMLVYLVKQNAELMEILKVGTNNTNNSHNNSHNKTFNLQFFLHETCKDAMNITDFINSIQPTLADLEKVGELGYAEGISDIIIKQLNNTEVTKRPIHCSDAKREVLYIKDNNTWTKEGNDKSTMINSIKHIAHKNMNNILIWQQANPGCTNADSKKNNKYLNIVSNSMPGLSDEEEKKNFTKIITRVAKSVTINKI